MVTSVVEEVVHINQVELVVKVVAELVEQPADLEKMLNETLAVAVVAPIITQDLIEQETVVPVLSSSHTILNKYLKT
tara:strand:- start:23 stop:253 length:231 start_codon:yes stop_codon:yes gene_type:complete